MRPGVGLLLVATLLGIGAGVALIARPEWFVRSEGKAAARGRGVTHDAQYFRRLGYILVACGTAMGVLLVARLAGIISIP